MHLHECVEDGVHILAFKGAIDMYYAPVLRSLLQAKTKALCPALILDMKEVEFIDSTGLAVIIEYFRDAASFGGVFCLAALQESVRTTFEICRLNKALPIFASRSEAKAGMKSGGTACNGEPLFHDLVKKHPA